MTPNQLITLPFGATIILDERIAASGSLTVNALQANYTSGTTNTNVVVASAHSDIDCLTLSPTPANVTVAGRVKTAGGQGILRVVFPSSMETAASARR
ncbi:MAG: choice-of-anchor P family protein [Pyrinomonadaceae bacterium]